MLQQWDLYEDAYQSDNQDDLQDEDLDDYESNYFKKLIMKNLRIRKKILRDCSNPFELPEREFLMNYRYNIDNYFKRLLRLHFFKFSSY